MFNCLCGHVGKVAVKDLMLKHDGDTTVEVVEKVARCSRCRGKNIIGTQIIYVGNSEFGMYNSHTLKDNKDLLKEQLPVFLFGQLFAYQLNARGEI